MLLSFINDLPPTTRTRFRWPTLSTSNSIWSNPALTENHASTADKINYLSSPASVRRTVVAYRTQVLTSIYRKPKPPVLLSACRPYLVDLFDGVWGGSPVVLKPAAAVIHMPLERIC
ncbi:hypothetical protein G6F18_014031 [Rhizopus arrhizus]|nr:hypothetical protein G6F18_014031 [Rhizopus arrhizus]